MGECFKIVPKCVVYGFTIAHLEPRQKKTNLKILERWSNDGTFDISMNTYIGKIKSITPNMEVSFELKIENMDSLDVDGYNLVLEIGEWFWFGIYKSTEASKFYIKNEQRNGLAYQNRICYQNPLSYTNDWQKEFLSKIQMTSFFANLVF